MLLLGPFRSNWPVLPPRTTVLFVLGLLLTATSGSMALPQPQSVLTSMTPVTTEDSENRAAELVPFLTGYSTRENWSCPLTNCSTWGIRSSTSSGQHSRADSVGGGSGELTPQSLTQWVWERKS